MAGHTGIEPVQRDLEFRYTPRGMTYNGRGGRDRTRSLGLGNQALSKSTPVKWHGVKESNPRRRVGIRRLCH